MKTNHKKKFNPWRLFPIIVIVVGFIICYFLGLFRYFTFTELQTQRATLLNLTATHPFISSLIFITLYIVATTFSFPGATLLTLAAGFLFGIIFGSLYVIVGATIGACGIFLATKTAFANLLEQKASNWVRNFEAGFQENAFVYLLFLRLLPLFPFWLVNIVPGLLNVRLRTFALATFIGIIPGTVVYVSVGNGLSSLFAQNQTPNLTIIFKPQILIPLILLALLSVVPIIYKKLKSKQA